MPKSVLSSSTQIGNFINQRLQYSNEVNMFNVLHITKPIQY